MDYFAHATAVIDPPCKIGAGTHIWHFCHLMAHCRVGTNCNLGQNVFVGSGVQIGNGVKIQNNVSLFEGVECADDVFIGPSVVFTNVLTPRAFISRKTEYISTIIERGVSIGANSTILCGVRLGEYCMVGAGSVVLRDVEPYTLVVGNPARVVGKVDKNGKKIQGNGKI